MKQSDLIRACMILFGHDGIPAPGLMRNLDPSIVKAAYRKRVFETHPDRSLVLGIPFSQMEERFKELSGAYDLVLRYALHRRVHPMRSDAPPKGPWDRRGFHRWHRPGGAAVPDSGELHTGEIPRRRLFIGQYLYYSRNITRMNLGAALVWQKMGRPLLGQIARKWKWLTPEDIRNILSLRRRGEKFGEAARRFGLLDPHQVMALLGRQRILQPRIGEYFISRGMLAPEAVTQAVHNLRAHNRKYR